MIYFNRSLQNRVHKLIYDSLAPGGFLALGSKESVRFTAYEEHYESLEENCRIYRKVR
jgi:chemotaxis protein methyltransferase CheR